MTTAFSYQRILTRRDKIFKTALHPYIDRTLTGSTPRDICKDIVEVLPASVSEGAVFESIRVLAGVTLSRKMAAELAWRLAGNVDKLQAGIPVLPWTQQMADERVPVCLEDMRPMRKKKIPGYLFYCRALAGSPCPMLFTQFISVNSCRGISQTLGFSKPWGPYPCRTPLNFVNLLFYAHVEAASSRTHPSFTKISVSSSMLKENREKIEIRCRTKPCPQQFTHPCAFCWVGYDKCEAAVHPITYVVRECPTCNSNGWFNPGEASLTCQQCRHKMFQDEFDTSTSQG
ncbi:hypothetical protein EBZ39_04515 [bacterium]|nr:hypothetical protein [bacterium]